MEKFNAEKRFDETFKEILDDDFKNILGPRGVAMYKMAFCSGATQVLHFINEPLLKLSNAKRAKFLIGLAYELAEGLANATEGTTDEKLPPEARLTP